MSRAAPLVPTIRPAMIARAGIRTTPTTHRPCVSYTPPVLATNYPKGPPRSLATGVPSIDGEETGCYTHLTLPTNGEVEDA